MKSYNWKISQNLFFGDVNYWKHPQIQRQYLAKLYNWARLLIIDPSFPLMSIGLPLIAINLIRVILELSASGKLGGIYLILLNRVFRRRETRTF